MSNIPFPAGTPTMVMRLTTLASADPACVATDCHTKWHPMHTSLSDLQISAMAPHAAHRFEWFDQVFYFTVSLDGRIVRVLCTQYVHIECLQKAYGTRILSYDDVTI